MRPPNRPEEVLSRYVVDGVHGCLLWTGCCTGAGYGWVQINSRRWYVHRLAWEQAHGPIPAGMQLDHLCRVRRCFNVEHLEVVTPELNKKRGWSPPAVNARKMHCSRGHELTGANLIASLPSNQRECRICKNHRRHLGAMSDAARERHNEENRQRYHDDRTSKLPARVRVVSGVRRTHCPRGHELAGANLCATETYRKCRICKNERRRELRAQLRPPLAL